MKAFLRYITRPSGFGRTEWGAWGTALGIALFGVWCYFDDPNTATVIVVGAIFLMIFLIFLWGTIKNFREDQRDLSNPKNHTNDIVGEGSPDPVWKKGNKPILQFERWVAARYEKPYDKINAWLDSIPFEQLDKYIVEFDRYVKRHS